jgi:hypothetical protein
LFQGLQVLGKTSQGYGQKQADDKNFHGGQTNMSRLRNIIRKEMYSFFAIPQLIGPEQGSNDFWSQLNIFSYHFCTSSLIMS